MKSIKLFLILVALCALSGTVSYAGDVVKDTLGTTASFAKTVETLLQGQVAGVRVWSQDGSPMSAAGVTIRGVNSLRGGQQPLYIVDGSILNDSNTRSVDPLWQYEDAAYASPLSQLSFLVPNDIESIEVLKNTAATALYGSKGANGVVIITTKKVKDVASSISWDSNVDVATPLHKEGTGLGISHNHKVMFGGTHNNASYTLSGYLRDDNYIIPGTGSTKGGLRASFETNANPAVWFGLNSHISVGNTSSASGAWYGHESYGVNLRNPEASTEGWGADFDDKALEFRAVNSMWLKLNLAKGFAFKFDLGTDFMSHKRSFWWGKGTPAGLEYNGLAANNKTSVFAYNASGVFDYNVFVAKEHKISVAAGAQALGSMEMFNTINGNDFFDHTLRAKGLNLAASKADLYKHNVNNFALGIFGQASYSWKDILGADIAYRTDFTPVVGTWNMYPSVSAYWDIKNSFLASSDAVSSLRLEGGYGESGRQQTMPYSMFGGYTAGAYEEVAPNAAAFYFGHTYQHTKEWNISLAMGFLENRLTLEAGYYHRNTTDNLTLYSNGEKYEYAGEEEEGEEPVTPPAEPAAPAADAETPAPAVTFWKYADRKAVHSQESVIGNNGFEFSLTGVPVKTADWTWSINVNGAYNINRVAKLAVEDAGGMAVGHFVTGEGEEAVKNAIVPTKNVEGSPVSSIVDENGAVIGNPTPKYYGGFGTTLRWKDLSLDILADGAADFDILNMNAMALDKATAVSAKYVEKGDFFRLARVSLAYNIPVKKVKWLDGIKVFATASNLAVVSDYSGWSPDVNSYAANNFRLGMDYGSYPAARSFVLGFNIKF